MGKRNNQLKVLANIAKQRLLKGEYTENEENNIFAPKVSNYFIKNASAMKKLTAKVEFVKIEGSIDSNFEEKVITLLEEDLYELCPFSKLIDFRVFNTLSTLEKQSYMLNISEKYNYLKEKYINKEKQAM